MDFEVFRNIFEMGTNLPIPGTEPIFGLMGVEDLAIGLIFSATGALGLGLLNRIPDSNEKNS